MFDRFDIWQYRSNKNCWDFVREYLIEKTSIPKEDLPKFGIPPSDKRLMTKASIAVSRNFIESASPVNFSIACQYNKNIILHVGIVKDGIVHHTSSQRGTIKESISSFERSSKTVKYMVHKTLWQH